MFSSMRFIHAPIKTAKIYAYLQKKEKENSPFKNAKN